MAADLSFLFCSRLKGKEKKVARKMGSKALEEEEAAVASGVVGTANAVGVGHAGVVSAVDSGVVAVAIVEDVEVLMIAEGAGVADSVEVEEDLITENRGAAMTATAGVEETVLENLSVTVIAEVGAVAVSVEVGVASERKNLSTTRLHKTKRSRSTIDP